MESPDKKPDNPFGCLFRVFWMGLGNLALFFCAYFILDRPGPFLALSVLDIAYWAVAAALAVARYVDIRSFGGNTVFGAPASMSDYRRYLLVLIGASICIWAAAHGVAALRA